MAPAIEAVLAAIRQRLATVTPSVDPSTLFVAEQDGVDVRTLTLQTCERHYGIRFVRHRESPDVGVQTPGVTDRHVKLAIEIAYPIQRLQGSLYQCLTSDIELFSRALGRSANWATTPVRRADVIWTREDVTGGSMVVAIGTVTVQYRDVE